MAIDTAFSSGPVAAHPAVQAWRTKETKVALARRATFGGSCQELKAQYRDLSISSATIEIVVSMVMRSVLSSSFKRYHASYRSSRSGQC